MRVVYKKRRLRRKRPCGVGRQWSRFWTWWLFWWKASPVERLRRTSATLCQSPSAHTHTRICLPPSLSLSWARPRVRTRRTSFLSRRKSGNRHPKQASHGGRGRRGARAPGGPVLRHGRRVRGDHDRAVRYDDAGARTHIAGDEQEERAREEEKKDEPYLGQHQGLVERTRPPPLHKRARAVSMRRGVRMVAEPRAHPPDD